jgi:hypothetical protein
VHKPLPVPELTHLLLRISTGSFTLLLFVIFKKILGF